MDNAEAVHQQTSLRHLSKALCGVRTAIQGPEDFKLDVEHWTREQTVSQVVQCRAGSHRFILPETIVTLEVEHGRFDMSRASVL
jgi:hypothetical protein